MKFVLALLAALAVTACNREEEFDYCKHHYEVHADHEADIARLDGKLSAEGVLTMHLKLPARYFDADPGAVERSRVLKQMMQGADQVYQLETDQLCSTAEVQVADMENGIELEYRSECGAGNQVRQVNIGLFDLIDSLEEVEVQMDTAATSKHFAISRQCKQAIFRLKPH